VVLLICVHNEEMDAEGCWWGSRSQFW